MRCLKQKRTVTYRAGTPEAFTINKNTIYLFKNKSCYIRLPTPTMKGANVNPRTIVDLFMVDNLEETTLDNEQWIYPHLYKYLKQIFMKYQFKIVSNFDPKVIACDSKEMFDGDGFEYEFMARDRGLVMLEQMGEEKKLYEVETYRDRTISADPVDIYEESYNRHY